MRASTRVILAAMALLLATVDARAGFVFDYPARSMHDLATGLRWTDTAPRGPMDPATSLVGGRWRVATGGEVDSLFESLGAATPGPYDADIAAVFHFLAFALPPPVPPVSVDVVGYISVCPFGPLCYTGFSQSYVEMPDGWMVTARLFPPAEMIDFDPRLPFFLVDAITPVPEPAAGALLIAGLGLLAGVGRLTARGRLRLRS